MTSWWLTPEWRALVLLAVLLPAAWQDERTRRVSNGLTVPLFLLAWPLSILWGTFPFALATFAGLWLAFQLGWLGGADLKVATAVAAWAPPALALAVALGLLVFAGQALARRLRRAPRPARRGLAGLTLFPLAAALWALWLTWPH